MCSRMPTCLRAHAHGCAPHLVEKRRMGCRRGTTFSNASSRSPIRRTLTPAEETDRRTYTHTRAHEHTCSHTRTCHTSCTHTAPLIPSHEHAPTHQVPLGGCRRAPRRTQLRRAVGFQQVMHRVECSASCLDQFRPHTCFHQLGYRSSFRLVLYST